MEQLKLTGIAPVLPAVKSKRKIYVGAPTTCNVCNGPFNGEMFDAKISGGSWANLCTGCFKRFGYGLGLGIGQRYVWEPEGWIKVAG